MRRPGAAQQSNGRAKRRIADSDDDEAYPVKGEQVDDAMDQDYDYGEEAEEEDEEDTKANVVRAKQEGAVNDNGYAAPGGVVDRATKELVRYMIGVHSQGKIITRDKLEALMFNVKLFEEKETRKGQKLSLALEKCVPYLRDNFGYRMERFDKSLSIDKPMDFKEKEIILVSCLPEEYRQAIGGEFARGPVSDEVFMGYVVACLAGLVINLGHTDYRTLNNYIIGAGLGQCLHKGKVKGSDDMIGLLCKNDYLNLFVDGGATLPHAKKQEGALKPTSKLTVVKDCKDLGLGHKDPEKAEIALGPKMYYEFDAEGVSDVFRSLLEEDETAGLEKKIHKCRFVSHAAVPEVDDEDEEVVEE